MAGPVGERRRTSRRTRPARWPRPTRVAGREASTCSTCSRTRAAPGLHVGHPLGYIGTDVYARFMRMTGHNVLHTMGYDAFGLPAEQYAVQTGQHPRVTTERRTSPTCAASCGARARPRPARGVATTDVALLPVDAVDLPADLRLLVRRRSRTAARPIAELVAELDAGARELPDDAPTGAPWASSTRPSAATRRRLATGSRTSTRRRSTGARRSAPCSPTRRSPPTAAASAATTRSSGAR